MKSKIEIQVHDSRCLHYNNRREKIKVGDFICHFGGVPPYAESLRGSIRPLGFRRGGRIVLTCEVLWLKSTNWNQPTSNFINI